MKLFGWFVVKVAPSNNNGLVIVWLELWIYPSFVELTGLYGIEAFWSRVHLLGGECVACERDDQKSSE